MYSNIEQIPERTLDNPLLSLKEQNAQLQFLRDTESQLHFPSIYEDQPYIHLRFVTAFATNMFSIFTLAIDSSRGFVIAQPIGSSQSAIGIASNEQQVYLTNGGQFLAANGFYPCWLIGHEIPRLLTYTGSDPDVNTPMRPDHLSSGSIIKTDNGPLQCVSKPETTRKLVWVTLTAQRVTIIDGKVKTANITYGGTGTIEVWRNGAATGQDKSVQFKWLGVTGQVILIGTKVKAYWKEDINGGAGGWEIDGGNCVVG